MAEDNNDLPSSTKRRLLKVDMDQVKHRANMVRLWVKRFAILLGIAFAFLVGFGLGARVHELGHAAGMFGKTLKGASVSVSGSCYVDGEIRNPALAEDQVIVTSVSDDAFSGVIRKTREKIDCELKNVSVETLPLLADIFKTPVPVPDITAAEKKAKISSAKLLENQILLVSGTCRGQLDSRELPPFTDEKIDVTAVEQLKDSDQFSISGIRRTDKLAIVCSSKSIRYSITDASTPVVVEKPTPPLTFINKILLVTSRCKPDPRLGTPPRGADGRKVAFYRLTNTEVQVIDETIKNEKLVKFTGSIVDKKSEGFGQVISCDQSVFPFTAPVKESDEDLMLERPDTQKSRPDSANKTQVETEDEAVVAPPAVSAKASTAPKKAPAAVVKPKGQVKEPEVVTPITPPSVDDTKREGLFKELDEDPVPEAK